MHYNMQRLPAGQSASASTAHVMNKRQLRIHRGTAVLVYTHSNSAYTSPPSANKSQHGSGTLGPMCLSRREFVLGGLALPEVAALLNSPALAVDAPLHEGALPSSSSSRAFSLGFENRISEFTLENGMHFLVLERHEAPVTSFMLRANVGAFDEEEGSTGLAHLLEHMAFKGTSELGSKDWAREGPLLEALDELFYELRDAKADLERQIGSAARVQRLEAQFKQLQAEAASLCIPNAFGSLLQQEGGVGLNATTSQDETKYFVSLPSNKLELWFALEARRFRDPVFRNLYSEKRVVEEERRLRIDTSPMGKYQQQFAAHALSNNYRRPVIGYAEDLERMGRKEVFSFFNRYYGPSNLTAAIVGDVSPEQVQRLAEQYFGDWNPQGYVHLPSGAELATLSRSEPLPRPASFLPASSDSGRPVGPSLSQPSAVQPALYREVSEAGPLSMLGFYRPALTTTDGVVLKVLIDLLASGRTSRLVSKLVLQDRSLLLASADAAYSGEKHAGLALVYARPANGSTPETADKILSGELERFLQEGPRQEELQRVKKASQAGLYSILQSNTGMADILATYHVLTGSWRGVVEELQVVEAMGLPECRRVAEQVFRDDNCYRGYIDVKRA